MEINSDFWAQRRVLITGHTGFKGAWLSLWLQALGAEVTGLAPGPPTSPSLYELAAVGASMREHAVDVRDADAVRAALLRAAPEIVIHLAAQPLVRRSLRDQGIGLSIPVGQLALFVVLAGLAGLLAGWLPARRAARLDVLGAINAQ